MFISLNLNIQLFFQLLIEKKNTFWIHLENLKDNLEQMVYVPAIGIVMSHQFNILKKGEKKTKTKTNKWGKRKRWTKSSKLLSFTFVHFEKRHLPFLPLECPDEQYGRNCLHTCSENCHVSKTCDKKTGACHGGCIEGWKLPQCIKGT